MLAGFIYRARVEQLAIYNFLLFLTTFHIFLQKPYESQLISLPIETSFTSLYQAAD